MTDGAARIIELIGNEKTKEDILPLLIRLAPQFFLQIAPDQCLQS